MNEGLLLRALTYFDAADAEAPLPGEGRDDWATVKAFFIARAGALLLPPARLLGIQSRVVDVAGASARPKRTAQGRRKQPGRTR